MPRRTYDPLDFVPTPEVVRQKLTETMVLADRLRVLLELAERLRLPITTADRLVPGPTNGVSAVEWPVGP
jgi:hypothetical protein